MRVTHPEQPLLRGVGKGQPPAPPSPDAPLKANDAVIRLHTRRAFDAEAGAATQNTTHESWRGSKKRCRISKRYRL